VHPTEDWILQRRRGCWLHASPLRRWRQRTGRTGHLQPALQLRRMLSHGGSIQQRLQKVTPKSRDEPACRRQGNGSTPSFHSHCTYTLSEQEPRGSITDECKEKHVGQRKALQLSCSSTASCC